MGGYPFKLLAIVLGLETKDNGSKKRPQSGNGIWSSFVEAKQSKGDKMPHNNFIVCGRNHYARLLSIDHMHQHHVVMVVLVQASWTNT